MLRHSRFSRVVPCAQLQTALLQTGQLFWTDLAPTPPLAASEDEDGGLDLSEGACQQDVPSQECMVTLGSPPTGKCQEPWKTLPEKHPKGHSAPQARSQWLLLHETPALPFPRAQSSPPAVGREPPKPGWSPAHARRPRAAASGAQRA